MTEKVADAAAYEAWYHTPRGAWIGEIEFRLLRRLLRAEPGETLLDVGCGTGYFTRRFAGEAGLRVTGLDPDPERLDVARAHGAGTEGYCLGRAEALPFADLSFDLAISVTALCFIEDQRAALREMVRVTRRRFALGLLNRRSLLHFRKGRHGGKGSYRGAHWHTGAEIRALLGDLPVANLALRTAVILPGGGLLARAIERLGARWLPLGALLVVAADVAASRKRRPANGSSLAQAAAP